MPLIHYEIDDSFYPISRRKVYKIFGVSIWTTSYVMQVMGHYVIWTDNNGNALNLTA